MTSRRSQKTLPTRTDAGQRSRLGPSSDAVDPNRIDEQLIDRAWENARAIRGFDPAQWRQDQCGAWMRRDQYGHEGSEFGWRILDVVAAHINEPDSLRAFHVRNTFDVAQGRPVCRLHADREDLGAGSGVDSPRNVEAAH